MLKSIKFSNDSLNLLFIRSAFPLGALHLCRLQKRRKNPIPNIRYIPKSVLCPYLQNVATFGRMADAKISRTGAYGTLRHISLKLFFCTQNTNLAPPEIYIPYKANSP